MSCSRDSRREYAGMAASRLANAGLRMIEEALTRHREQEGDLHQKMQNLMTATDRAIQDSVNDESMDPPDFSGIEDQGEKLIEEAIELMSRWGRDIERVSMDDIYHILVAMRIPQQQALQQCRQQYQEHMSAYRQAWMRWLHEDGWTYEWWETHIANASYNWEAALGINID